MVLEDIKPLIKGKAEAICVKSGGIIVYKINAIDGKTYILEIDVSDKHDVGEDATFMLEYNNPIYLMRWIRRANENNTLVETKI